MCGDFVLITFLRMLFGFVEFEATGGFPERFLNLCYINGITLWNVQNDGVKVKACTPIKAYKNIRKSAHNSGMKVRITRKRGLPFFFNNNKARVGVLVGVVISVAFLFSTTCVLWNVEITGNENIKSEILLNSLESYNVKVGAFKSKIDTNLVESELLKEYEDLSWVSINIFGTKAVLEVKENKEKPEVISDDTLMNVVARKDGKIILIQGHKGRNVVKENDYVLKGDLLVSGILINSDGSEKPIHATGKVFAETKTVFEKTIVREEMFKLVNKTSFGYRVYLLGIEIPVNFWRKGYKLYSGKNLLRSGDTQLPVGVSWSVFGELNESEVALTDNQAVLLALLDSVEGKRREFSDESEIIKCNYEKNVEENEICVKGIVVAKEDIAVEKEIFLE